MLFNIFAIDLRLDHSINHCVLLRYSPRHSIMITAFCYDILCHSIMITACYNILHVIPVWSVHFVIFALSFHYDHLVLLHSPCHSIMITVFRHVIPCSVSRSTLLYCDLCILSWTMLKFIPLYAVYCNILFHYDNCYYLCFEQYISILFIMQFYNI